MGVSRLSYAIDAGSLVLPQSGDIAVFRPAIDCDLTAFDKARIEIIHGGFPEHHSFQSRGYRVSLLAAGQYSSAVVFLPRSKALARALISTALTVTGGGPVVIDGHKTDGVDSVLKDCRKHGASIGTVIAKAHGKVFSISGGDFSDWVSGEKSQIDGGFLTSAGVFSMDAIDKGSAALVWALPETIKGRIADLGAGWGYLSHHILQRKDVRECHLIEAEHDALDCARVNITDPRANFHWADALTFNSETEFDHVICNPPFHIGRAADPSLGRAFIAAAARLLGRHGTLWLVANRHLPYEQVLSEAFKEVSEISGDGSFKVFRAKKPRRDLRK